MDRRRVCKPGILGSEWHTLLYGGFYEEQSISCDSLLTIGEEKLEEELAAQPHLSYFADLRGNIFNIAMVRLKIPVSYYTKPLGIPIAGADSGAQKGREAFARFWELQQKYNEMLKEYQNYYNMEDNKKIIEGQRQYIRYPK